ncbi:coiled-coil domain-containing protein 89-like [Symsagittifera roscoffensis]|uniref:coiled-coil domain-containing protein 89-like n=1 Tax=Symsagittifera roscoffensis TaxID=84072 RepID=UPI00307C1949
MDENVRNALKHCKNLPASDKTEVGLLKSRIDEQSNLIMILKTRADDEYKRRKVFEDLVDGLQHTINEYEEQVEADKLKFRLLEENFDVLASNHHEMIQIKDEYKQQNEKFRMKNESILEENRFLLGNRSAEKAQAVKTLNQTIEQLQKELQAVSHDKRKTDAEFIESRNNWNSEKESFERQLTSLNKALDGSLKEVARITDELKEEKTMSSRAHSDLKRDKDKYMELARDRGVLVEEKTAETKRVTEKLASIEKELNDATSRFEREAMRVDKDLLVQDLRKRAAESESKLSQFEKEYSAFVNERNNRLNKEIELNKHLKQLLNA